MLISRIGSRSWHSFNAVIAFIQKTCRRTSSLCASALPSLSPFTMSEVTGLSRWGSQSFEAEPYQEYFKPRWENTLLRLSFSVDVSLTWGKCHIFRVQNLAQSIIKIMFRSDPETAAKLSRTGQSLVTLEQAVAVSTQIGAECYVETKALVSSLETLEVDRLSCQTIFAKCIPLDLQVFRHLKY